MVHVREELPLGEKTVEPGRSFRAGVKHFDSDLLLDLAIGALREVHGAHAAGADEAQAAVRAPIFGGFLAVEHVRCRFGDGSGQLVIVVGIERQQRFDFGPDIGRNLSLVERLPPFGRGKLRQFLEQAAHHWIHDVVAAARSIVQALSRGRNELRPTNR